jgi:predicted cytidylate kinase
MILTISGLHGTGKSAVGKLLANALHIKYYSTGSAYRDFAKSMNMSLENFTKHVENNPEIDIKLDERIKEIAKADNILIDSQLSGFILESIADFKIHLTCPLEIRVERIAKRDNLTYEEALQQTLTRENSEKERFKKLYNIDLDNTNRIKKIHDIILDTKELSIEEVVEFLLKNLKSRNYNKF